MLLLDARVGNALPMVPTTSPALRMPNTSARPKSARRSLRSLYRLVSKVASSEPPAIYVGAQLAALFVAEQGGVGQQQGRVFLQVLGREFVFVHEIEEEAAFEQGVDTCRPCTRASAFRAGACRTGGCAGP